MRDCETSPVFVVIGLGSTPNAPEHVYCIPLEAMQDNTLTFEDVRPLLEEDHRAHRLLLGQRFRHPAYYVSTQHLGLSSKFE
jgi:hypothetical protein